jgi:pyrophosphate--fructose-6-phosphate 1-phosphotransferase
VIVGGDDSNTIAAFLAEYCVQQGLKTCIVGVPKTIDGDLRHAFIEMSFGFDTACKIYSEMIGNLLKDSLSAKKYYFFVKLMGRSASHVTLECALQTQVNLAIISEEVAARKQTLSDLVGQIATLICERADQGKNYGVILIPEGLLEFIPDFQHVNQTSSESFSTWPEEVRKQLLLDRDPHGNLQVSKIETERLLIALVEQELTRRKQQGHYAGKFSPQPLFYGYEGRSGLPSNFDSQYCYALGHVAALLIQHQASGYLCCLSHLSQPAETWQMRGVPLVELLHTEMRKNKEQVVIQKFLVDLEGPVFKLFDQKREEWRLKDLYCCPGPIQFEGPPKLTDQPPLTLLYEKIKEKS